MGAYFPEFVQYLAFSKTLKQRRFEPRSASELSLEGRDHYLIRPKSRSYQEPGEVGFVYKPLDPANDYRVIVWSTKRRIGWVTRDSGWVIVVNTADKKVRTSYPFVRRSPAFLEDLLEEARTIRWKVVHRPKCCSEFMNIVHNRKALKSCYWQCAVHPENRSHDVAWDDVAEPLPADVLERKKASRAVRRKRRKTVRAAGRDAFAAFKERMAHPWQKKLVQMELQF